jgi:cell division inhibitor SepF
MAGAMRKMAVYLGLVEDDDRYYEDYDEYDERRDGRDERHDRGERPERHERAPREERPRPVQAVRDEPRGASVGTMPERPAPRPVATATVTASVDRITTIHPRTYNEAKTIGEAFREGTPVIMNLTDMDDSDAKRLVDFAAGLVFGLRGTIERVTNKVFLLSPANVTVTAEDKARMAESGFFNQS